MRGGTSTDSAICSMYPNMHPVYQLRYVTGGVVQAGILAIISAVVLATPCRVVGRWS
jgi:hypothetical protein